MSKRTGPSRPGERIVATNESASQVHSGDREHVVREHAEAEGTHAPHAEHGRAVTPQSGSNAPQQSGLDGGDNGNSIGPLASETARFGRDDLKRGEAGSAGGVDTNETGAGLSHLTGLGDEEPGLRNGEKISSSNNSRFVGEQTGVGAGVDHLWLLGDFEYYRASTDHREVDGILPDLGSAETVYGPLIDGPLAFQLVEDNTFAGAIFSAEDAILPANDIVATIDQKFGTITLNPDGTFEHTPPPGFSGKAEFNYEFKDPRTGEQISGTVELTVEAVADPASISGAARTPEDTLVSIPVEIELGDTDGSESICSVDITKVPAGATLGFSGTVAATFENLANGGLRLTGSTADVQAALQLLTFDPPLHFSGRVTLDVTVKTIEDNADPSVPGYRDTETVVHPYHIDVTPVADQPTVAGGNFTTDEDQRVALAGLDGKLVDTDNSEVLKIEIRGVDPNAKLENAAGIEFPFVTTSDGSKTYTIDPTKIGGVFYNPPPNEHGTFNMTIVPIATEQANNDQASNTAPIQVVISPVDDLPTVGGASATNEDTTVNFGNNIAIGPVIDTDGSEQFTQVTITGVPAGITPTGTPVGSATINFNPATGTIEVSGGTEQDIRDTVKTLSVTPLTHRDDEITLQVSVETTDAGVVATSTPTPHPITVSAVADAPTLSAVANGTEDNPIALPITTALVDTDGSETFDYAEITMPASITLNLPGMLPNGIQVNKIGDVYTFTPGTATTAQFANFLATGIQINPPLDSNVDFPVTVKIGTIESTPVGGQISVERADTSTTITVGVTPVVDTPTINSTSEVNEDAIADPALVPSGANIVPHGFGAVINTNINLGETAVGDTSESITQIVVSDIPQGTEVTYTQVGGGSITQTAGAGGLDITLTGGTETQIRAALASMTMIPPQHSDDNISLDVAVTVLDTDPDNADGSERIKDVVINNVPAGFTLTTTSALGTLTLNGGGSYTVTGANDAAINDVLANLNLTIAAAPNARTHLDTNFNLSVTVTSEENNPSEAGAGEMARLENAQTFPVPVTVHAIADPVTHSGSSVIVEDIARKIGSEIQFTKVDNTDGSEDVTTVTVTGFPAGATISYDHVTGGGSTTLTVPAGGHTVTLTGGTEAQIRAALDSLYVTAPLHTDDDFTLTVSATTTDNTTSPNTTDHTETTT